MRVYTIIIWVQEAVMSGKKKQEKESLATFRRITEMDRMIASGAYPNVQAFRDKFEISEATVHRDLDALRYDFGADEYLCYDRIKKGYYYTSPTFRIPAQLTTEKQIVAAQLMANLLKTLKGSPIYEQAVGVFSSLSSNIEQDTKLNARKLSNRVLFLGMAPVAIDDSLWGQLEEAMAGNRYAEFDYQKGNRAYRITIQPYQLIYYNGMWTLYGKETNPGFEGEKFFNLPGIKNFEIKKETFELPSDFSYEKHAIGNFGRHIGDKTYHFEIKILASWLAEYIRTYNWAPDQRFRKQKDRSTIMSFTSNQYNPVLDWVLEKGKNVQPLKPERLVKAWKENAIAMAAMAKEM